MIVGYPSTVYPYQKYRHLLSSLQKRSAISVSEESVMGNRSDLVTELLPPHKSTEPSETDLGEKVNPKLTKPSIFDTLRYAILLSLFLPQQYSFWLHSCISTKTMVNGEPTNIFLLLLAQPSLVPNWLLECSSLSRAWLFATPWTAAHQAPLSIGFSRQGYWSGLPFPSPGDLPDPGIKPGLLHCRQILYWMSYQGRPSHNTEYSSPKL